MKKRIRKTGEIVDVIDWFNFYRTERDKEDTVSYVDSKGVEHHNERGLNLWWDFEDVDYPINCDTMELPKCGYIKTGLIDVETLNTDIDWEQRRYEIAKTVVHGQLTGPVIDGVDPNPSIPNLAKLAVEIADSLIAELKKGGEK